LEARLGDQAQARGDLLGAATHYNRALAIDPRSVDALVGLGEVSLKSGHAADAATRFESALAIDPDAARAKAGLAAAR
jgi:predicted TPR repeat methyltransferase